MEKKFGEEKGSQMEPAKERQGITMARPYMNITQKLIQAEPTLQITCPPAFKHVSQVISTKEPFPLGIPLH